MEEIAAFRAQQQTLLLATCSEQGQLLNSYAPFVETKTAQFYLLLSDMAEHSQNLHYHEHTQTLFSIMLIEDEAACRNVFARKRLTYQCRVQRINREQSKWQPAIETLQQKFGKTIELLSSLADFNLYFLTPQTGNYVRGFGQAYPLDSEGVPVIEHPVIEQ